MTKQQLGTIWSTLVPKGQRVKGQRLDRLSGGAKRLSCSRSRSRGGVSSWSCCCWLFSSSSSLLCNPDNCCRCCSTWKKENLLKTQNVLIAVNSSRVKKWLFYTKISQNHSKQPEGTKRSKKKKKKSYIAYVCHKKRQFLAKKCNHSGKSTYISIMYKLKRFYSAFYSLILAILVPGFESC